MTKLNWDKVGERFYEAGVDRGVLYLPDNTAVPWNGLISIDKNGEDATTPLHIDGVKYLDLPTIAEYSAKLSAYTYPDEFLPFEGFQIVGDELGVDGQVSGQFGLSYRVKVGNDVDGTDHGYKIHLVYNLTAIPEDFSHDTLTDQASVTPFSWALEAVPENVPGYFPTAHAIIDSTKVGKYLLQKLETILYGSDDFVPDFLDGNEDDEILDAGFIDPEDYGLDGNDDAYILDGDDPGEEIEGNVPEVVESDPIDGGSPYTITIPGTIAYLPPLSELVELALTYSPITVVDNGDGTWTATGPSDRITVYGDGSFRMQEILAEYITPDRYRMETT